MNVKPFCVQTIQVIIDRGALNHSNGLVIVAKHDCITKKSLLRELDISSSKLLLPLSWENYATD